MWSTRVDRLDPTIWLVEKTMRRPSKTTFAIGRVRNLLITGLLLAMVFCVSTANLRAGEAEEFYDFYTFYQGKWAIEEETEGKKETYTGNCFGSEGGCNVYVGKGETSVWGYDPKTKQWTGVGQLDDGGRFVMAISRPPGPKFKPGMTFTFTGTIWHADGSIHYVTNVSTCVDENTTRGVITGTDQDGKPIPKVTKTFKRMES